MKKILSILCLAGAILPASTWADTVNVNSISDPRFQMLVGSAADTALATSAIAVSSGSTALTSAESLYELNGAIANGTKYVPYSYANYSGIVGKLDENTQRLITETQLNREGTHSQAKIVNVSPREVWAKAKAVQSGDILSEVRNQLERTFNQVADNLANTFSEQMLETILNNLIYDILSCQTPQLDMLFPSIDLNIGLALCDYGQMFDEMKSQTKNLSNRGWGGSFKINGQDASSVIKDPKSLEDAITLTPPGVGHSLVADFLSDQSVNLSVQGNVNAKQIAEEMGANIKMRDTRDLFGNDTLIKTSRRMEEQNAKIGQILAYNNETAAGIAAAEAQLQAEQLKVQAKAKADADTQHARQSLSRQNITVLSTQ